VAAVAALMVIPTSWVEHGPSLCLIRAIFHTCPFCGTVRALSHFFHGEFAEAVRWNINVVLTGPLLAALAAKALLRWLPLVRDLRRRPLHTIPRHRPQQHLNG